MSASSFDQPVIVFVNRIIASIQKQNMKYDVACELYMININVKDSFIHPIPRSYDLDEITDAVPALLGSRRESFDGDFRSFPWFLLSSAACDCCSRKTWATVLVGSNSSGFRAWSISCSRSNLLKSKMMTWPRSQGVSGDGGFSRGLNPSIAGPVIHICDCIWYLQPREYLESVIHSSYWVGVLTIHPLPRAATCLRAMRRRCRIAFLPKS